MKTTAKRLDKILTPDTDLGSRRNTRLHASDDDEVVRHVAAGETESAVIRELTQKGLAYERLEKGAKDTVIRQLLRDLNEIVSHHVQEATAPLKDQLTQTNLFLATLFASTHADLKFPVIENLNDDQRTGL